MFLHNTVCARIIIYCYRIKNVVYMNYSDTVPLQFPIEYKR